MNPASPVLPGLNLREEIFALDQPQYLALPALYFPLHQGLVLTRWEPTIEERRAIALGAHLFVSLLTFGQPLQPVRLDVAAADDYVALLELCIGDAAKAHRVDHAIALDTGEL